MRKKVIKSSIVLFMLIGIIVSLVGFSDYLFAYKDEHDPGGGGGGTTLWYRHDDYCNDPEKPWRQKTFCNSGGNEQCTAQYCN